MDFYCSAFKFQFESMTLVTFYTSNMDVCLNFFSFAAKALTFIVEVNSYCQNQSLFIMLLS